MNFSTVKLTSMLAERPNEYQGFSIRFKMTHLFTNDCISCFYTKIANVGDSRAVLGRRDYKNDGILIPIALTFEHSPDNAEEVKRIVECGGSVYSRQISRTQQKTNCGIITTPVMGPPRVWFPLVDRPGSLMGLAMTRSLGDYSAHQVGVVTQPHVNEHTIQDNDEFIVLATDGLWDMVTYKDCMYLIEDFILSLDDPKKWDPQEAAEMLANFARKKWEQVDGPIDDITCMIIRLDF